ncbi:MAG: aspartate aminotransferase [Candidatus Raymondbacteria bacterium RifOxyA12_full_50_37]|uniref:Aminotransferase n=1 Tax=Candidatus Raymondbacteria bacterium RIFOXYD12_FULL_49_13 TaxID=1817890 RepID=A0A1F7F4D4_UNCRA|nr:MAG: aspartate aminotransferase [Candidatus Raymondbacteria bacterium RifOxyA12_full_50_37]OGJ86324.1 MAG: aspartate aminotransferase [Candidatus Raymondbacteria bacterium RIFOXYA2_FULL_49_16]OGJ95862.1 MAG: aspartate aminotransferase [Candidatus Raymondbacteria bacterium RIFOXYC2_FULL_50_21]OGJ98029.1 MAG: aspartate aminotransferase [Candidatus Raymondbacteria bacterium RifOxyC12_full_50_8]OGJ98343.1 MAG: aspartate aminotransferase [Candidatus Raymondbacteria bacterium RifOxyB12_full_50_8]
MSVSTRGKNVPKSAIRKLIPFAKEREKTGVKIIKLNIGQPDIETPEEFWQGVRDFKERVLAYAPSEGRAELVKSFVTYYNKYGITVTTSDIVVIMGGIEGILFALLAATDPGDEVIVAEPYYSNYLGVAAMAQVNFVAFTTTAENGYHLPAREEIVKKITPRTKAVLISSPGNPTGCVYTRKEMELLASIANEHGLFLISDEVYREFAYDGEEATSVMQIPGTEQCGIIIDSVSKRYSACGARLGCVVSKNKEFMASVLSLATVRLSAGTLDQVAIANCINTPDAYFEKVRKEYVERRDIVVKGLSAIPGVVCPSPKGAFYVMAKIKGVDTEEFAKWLLTDFADNNETVMIAPGAGFYATPGLGRDEIRIAYVFKAPVMKRAMEILAQAIQTFRSLKK